jgi:hypothetical protein
VACVLYMDWRLCFIIPFPTTTELGLPWWDGETPCHGGRQGGGTRKTGRWGIWKDLEVGLLLCLSESHTHLTQVPILGKEDQE